MTENTDANEPYWKTARIFWADHFAEPGRMQLRFVATDAGIESIVEAALDDLTVLADLGGDVPIEIAPADAALPDTLTLGASAPSPFNPQATILYGLPAADPVRLGVYDATGRLVRLLVDTIQPAGTHAVVWDGTDRSGRNASSGIYFCRLEAEARTRTQKMMLAR